jgi:hypothetical protein
MARVILGSYPKTTMRYILRRAEELATKAYQYNALPIHGLEALSTTEWRRSFFLCCSENICIIQTTNISLPSFPILPAVAAPLLSSTPAPLGSDSLAMGRVESQKANLYFASTRTNHRLDFLHCLRTAVVLATGSAVTAERPRVTLEQASRA